MTAREAVGQALHKMLFSDPSATVFTILDGASVPDLTGALHRLDPEHICLYIGELAPDMTEVAPHLVILKAGAPFTEWVLSCGWGTHWGIFGVARADLATLRRHFRSFLLIYDENVRSLYFRFYDPRVWRDFLPLCDQDELETLFGPVSHFVLEDEDPKQGRIFLLTDSGLQKGSFRFDGQACTRMPTATAPLATRSGSRKQLHISGQRLEDMSRMNFYARLYRFVNDRCKRAGLREWVSDPVKRMAFWDRLWPDVRHMSEHDCAMLLVYATVCKCEGIAADLWSGLPEDVADQEQGIKQFLADHGYFRFSDFDFKGGNQDDV